MARTRPKFVGVAPRVAGNAGAQGAEHIDAGEAETGNGALYSTAAIGAVGVPCGYPTR